MVRTSRRKNLEEIYSAKLDSLPQPFRQQTMQPPGMTRTATMRVASARPGGESRTQRSYVTPNDYYITTNLPLNATNMRPADSRVIMEPSKIPDLPPPMHSECTQACQYGSTLCRRARQSSRSYPVPVQHPKVHFIQADAKSHGPPTARPVQVTQRTVYPSDMMPNGCELSDKDARLSNSNSKSRRLNMQQNHQHGQYPVQHQLHQQQLMNHSSEKDNRRSIHNNAHQQQQQKYQERQQSQLPQANPPPHPHQHDHQSSSRMTVNEPKDDKEDDPEEFFELMQQTVKKAVGNIMNSVLRQNFCQLSKKMDNFSNELKVTNERLGKLRTDVTKKITQYGDENNRQFRYLCMKAEYDKMFYQHQTEKSNKLSTEKKVSVEREKHALVLGSKPTRVAKQTSAHEQKSVEQPLAAENSMATENANERNLTRYKSTARDGIPCTPKGSASHRQQLNNNRITTQSSSELTISDALEQFQRIYDQAKLNREQPKYSSMTTIAGNENQGKGSAPNGITCGGVTARGVEEVDSPENSMDELDMDHFQYSSDEVYTYSEDDSDETCRAKGSSTSRLHSSNLLAGKNKGAGDAQ